MMPMSRCARSIIVVLVLVPLFKPAGLGQLPAANALFHVWKVVALVLVGAYLVRHRRDVRLGTPEVSLVAFWVCYLVGCLMSGSSVFDVANGLVTSFVLLVLVRTTARLGRAQNLLRSMAWVFAVELVLQVLSMAVVRAGITLFPGDYTYMYLFGEDNYSAFMTLPMAAVVLFWAADCGDRRAQAAAGILWAVLFGAYAAVQSVAATLGFAVLGLAYLLRNWRGSFARHMPLWLVGACFVGLLLLVMVFHVQVVAADALESLFVAGLGKDLYTLNSRTIIWEQAWQLICQRPLFGWGDGVTGDMIWAGHAHNLMLEVALRSGWIGLASYLAFVASSYARAGRLLKEAGASVLVGAIAAFALTSFFDFYPMVIAPYGLFAVVTVVPELHGESDDEHGMSVKGRPKHLRQSAGRLGGARKR